MDTSLKVLSASACVTIMSITVSYASAAPASASAKPGTQRGNVYYTNVGGRKSALSRAKQAQHDSSARPVAARRAALEQTSEGREVLRRGRQMLGEVLIGSDILGLASLRLKKGLTQTELASLSGVAQPHISRLESGRVTPDLATLQKLAPCLDASIEQLASLFAPPTA